MSEPPFSHLPGVVHARALILPALACVHLCVCGWWWWCWVGGWVGEGRGRGGGGGGRAGWSGSWEPPLLSHGVIACTGGCWFHCIWQCQFASHEKRDATRSAALTVDMSPAPVAGTYSRSAGTVHARQQSAGWSSARRPGLSLGSGSGPGPVAVVGGEVASAASLYLVIGSLGDKG